MGRSLSLSIGLVLLIPALLAYTCPPLPPVERDELELPGLEGQVRVTTDTRGVPHVYAQSLLDAFRVQGYLHARDRLFQMDLNRATAHGRRAELTGNALDLFADAQARLVGARAAAERSWALFTTSERAIFQAYADGVNAWLAANPLPAEYAELEISQVAPWDPVDTMTMWVAAGAGAHINLNERQFSDLLETYKAALGEEAGRALFLEDVARVGPIEPGATVPSATGEFPFVPCAAPPLRTASRIGVATSRRDSGAQSVAAFRLPDARRGARGLVGSNAWGVAASKSASQNPMVATDGHGWLSTPSRDYEMHLVVEGDPVIGNWIISGTTELGFPGFPSVFQTRHLAATVTLFEGDLSDIFRDRLIRGDPACRNAQGELVRLCIASEGELHPVVERSETYRLNTVGNGVPDDSVDLTASIALLAPYAVNVLSVPFRSFGPVIAVDDRSVVDDPGDDPAETDILTVQYTGLEPVPGVVEGLLRQLTARDVFEFEDALRSSGRGENWIVADVEGNLAYFLGDEIPLRRDLEEGRIEGEIPAFVRDGSGPANWIPDPERSQGQRLPFRVIPPEEMPRVVNPASGFVASTNEDPSGADFDGDVANQCRPSNPDAIYYLGGVNPANSQRAGSITHLLREQIEAGLPVSMDDMKRFQGDTRQLDAEAIVPFLLQAFDAALRPDAPPELAAFALDPEIAEAIDRLSSWDFTTPTGIPEGYDASDVDGFRGPLVTPEEAAHSVAATIYAAWRGHAIRSTLWQALADAGLPRLPDEGGIPPYYVLDLYHHLSQDPFTGVGASGIDFFPEPAALPAADRRNATLLAALRDALDDLASNGYAAAFGNSTDQDDYLWGRLHRITFEHPLGGDRSIPPAAGFEDLAPNLPGLARDGGSSLNFGQYGGILSAGSNAYEFSHSARYRFAATVGHPLAGWERVLGFANLPGGSSGDADHPLYALQLAKWLTVDYHRVPMSYRDVRLAAERIELFTPPLL